MRRSAIYVIIRGNLRWYKHKRLAPWSGCDSMGRVVWRVAAMCVSAMCVSRCEQGSVCLFEFEEVGESRHVEDIAYVGVHAGDIDMATPRLGVLEHAEEEPEPAG